MAYGLMQLLQTMFNLMYTSSKTFNYSNIFNLKQHNSENIHIFNMYVVYAIEVFKIPSAMLSLVHIVLNHVVLTHNIFPPYCTRPSFVS